MPNIPEKSCINCHFLCYIINPNKTEKYIEFKEKERDDIKTNYHTPDHGDLFYINDDFGCLHKIWRSDYLPKGNDDPGCKEELVNKIRNDCFFLKHKPGVLPIGAVELQKREQENEKFDKQFKTSNRNSIAALITALVSILALIASIIVHFIK